MKVIFLKQSLDIVGPRSSYSFAPGIEKLLLEAFKGKVSLYEMLVYLKADFAIVPTTMMAPWLKTLTNKPGFVDEMMNTTANVVEVDQLDLGQYDVVITHDPFLRNIKELKEKFPNTVFAYILAEHTSYGLHQYGFDYDLYLDHTYNSGEEVVRLPQSINCVFSRIPDKVRELFGSTEKKSIFADYRTIGHFLHSGSNNVAITIEQANSYTEKLEKLFNLPIERISPNSLKPFMVGNEKSDAIEYYNKLGRSKYFLTVANRVGQAAFDAASMGALVFGSTKSKLHQMLCPPELLIEPTESINDIRSIIEMLDSYDEEYERLLSIQEENFKKLAVERPLELLTKACEIKRS